MQETILRLRTIGLISTLALIGHYEILSTIGKGGMPSIVKGFLFRLCARGKKPGCKMPKGEPL